MSHPRRFRVADGIYCVMRRSYFTCSYLVETADAGVVAINAGIMHGGRTLDRYSAARLRRGTVVNMRSRRPRIIPPVYFLSAILAMIALHRWFPIRQIFAGPLRCIGLAPIALGLAFGGSAARLFFRRQTAIRPGDTSTSLVTDGPFRFSRNPMYVGMLLLLAGAAIFLGSISPWLVIPLFITAISFRIIPVEEAMLRATFGEPYRGYQLRVRRWI